MRNAGIKDFWDLFLVWTWLRVGDVGSVLSNSGIWIQKKANGRAGIVLDEMKNRQLEVQNAR